MKPRTICPARAANRESAPQRHAIALRDGGCGHTTRQCIQHLTLTGRQRLERRSAFRVTDAFLAEVLKVFFAFVVTHRCAGAIDPPDGADEFVQSGGGVDDADCAGFQALGSSMGAVFSSPTRMLDIAASF